jgi:hypothetical protein
VHWPPSAWRARRASQPGCDRYVRALDKTAHGLRVPFIDATPVLRALAPAGFLPDTYHLSAEGHAHLAALLTGPLVDACADVPSVVEAALGRPAPTSTIRLDARM